MSDGTDDVYRRERDEASAHEERRANRRLSIRWRRLVGTWRDLAGDDRKGSDD